ncbi:MAG: D-alanyl-D-alanine carboxypeptidase/D-alanyl-D-alanine-endopeptidase [Bacteroidota bacterium]
MKISMLLFLILITHGFVAQKTTQQLVDDFAKDPTLENASISIQFKEIGVATNLAEYRPKTAIPTASTAKLFSTSSAIEILGPDYRPITKIYHTGTIENGVLKGDVWIIGGGDPSLGSKYFNGPGKEDAFLFAWVDSIKSKGIAKIEGRIIADGSSFGYAGVPDGWIWSDMGNYYGAGPAGINVFDNMIRYNFNTGDAGTKAKLVNEWPKQAVQGNFIIGITAQNVSGDNSYIFGAPYSFDRFSTGSLPINQANFEVKGSMPDPELQLAYLLNTYLLKSEIKVSGGFAGVRHDLNGTGANIKSGEFKLLFQHKGRTIKEIAAITNEKSVNLFAEALVCLIAFRNNGIGTTEIGLKEIEKYFGPKISTNGLFLNDGSGLSRSNGISASHFCSLLEFMNSSKNYTPFFNTLPIAGKSGTITSLCKGQAGEGRVFAKSGSMNKVKSYAGYITAKSGKKYVFAITVNNYNCSTSTLVNKMEVLLNSVAIL